MASKSLWKFWSTRNWGETSWLKMKMLTRIALQRGWRSVLISDCGAESKGTFEFKGFGGSWLVVFNGRCGVLLDPGMANMLRRGGAKRFDSPDGRSLAVIVPCAGRGLRGRVLLLFPSMVLFPMLGWTTRRGLWGEVLTDDRDPRALGADSLTNNSGELWALAEAFLWFARRVGRRQVCFGHPCLWFWGGQRPCSGTLGTAIACWTSFFA